MTDIEDLRKRVEAIELHLGFAQKPEFVRRPMPKYDPMEHVARLPPNIVEAMAEAVPTDLVRAIVNEQRRR